jgi:hypothetical protein
MSIPGTLAVGDFLKHPAANNEKQKGSIYKDLFIIDSPKIMWFYHVHVSMYSKVFISASTLELFLTLHLLLFSL